MSSKVMNVRMPRELFDVLDSEAAKLDIATGRLIVRLLAKHAGIELPSRAKHTHTSARNSAEEQGHE